MTWTRTGRIHGPRWLSSTTPCVQASRGQWRKARALLARDDEGEQSCAIVSSRGKVVGIVMADGREAWVRGDLIQPRRGCTARGQIAARRGYVVSLPPLSSVPNGYTVTIVREGDAPVRVVPHALDAKGARPDATVNLVRVGGGWRRSRIKLRSGLLRYEDWGP